MFTGFLLVLVVEHFDTGDEHDSGGPGLPLAQALVDLLWPIAELLLLLVVSKEENEFSVSTVKDPNRLDEKFGMPQLTQCHEMLWSDINTGVDMCMQSAWYHWSQSSQATPLCFHVTARWHIWHGYLGVRGPGFSSMSDALARRIRLRYKRVWFLSDFWMERVLSFLDTHVTIMPLFRSSYRLNDFWAMLDCCSRGWWGWYLYAKLTNIIQRNR